MHRGLMKPLKCKPSTLQCYVCMYVCMSYNVCVFVLCASLIMCICICDTFYMYLFCTVHLCLLQIQLSLQSCGTKVAETLSLLSAGLPDPKSDSSTSLVAWQQLVLPFLCKVTSCPKQVLSYCLNYTSLLLRYGWPYMCLFTTSSTCNVYCICTILLGYSNGKKYSPIFPSFYCPL